MSQTQPITIELPSPIFDQLQEISVTTQQPIEQLITQRLLGTMAASPSAETAETEIPTANLHLITRLIKLALSFSPEECQILDQRIQSSNTELDSIFSELAPDPSSPMDLPTDDTIRKAITIGLEALAAGNYEDYDEAGLDNLFEDIKRNGRLQRGIEA